ncbi:leucine-rich repeat transmembrane protein CCDC168-like [Glossophaga mutica]
MNIRIKDKSMPTFTRSSVSPVNSQESSDSEEVVYVEPITRDILISPLKGKQRMPRNKKEVGVQTISLTFPEHQGRKMQASKDEREAEMQRGRECDFGTPKKTALQNEDDSGIFIRSLSVSVMSPSQTEETVEFETNLEREKKICLSKSPKKSPSASDIVKRNNSSTVKKGGQDFTKVIPEDSQPFMVDQKRMQKPPSIKSEENLSSEVNEKCLTAQTEERVVLEHISKIIKESDFLIIEQEEKVLKPILTPTEHPGMSEDPKESVETHIKSTLNMNTSPPGAEEPQHETQPVDTVECASPPKHRGQSEPIQDTTTPKVQGQKPFSGTVPRTPQVKSNEIKIVADSTCTETLPILYEAIKNVFESQIKNMTQDKVYADILEKVKACYPHDWKTAPFVRAPDITSTTIHPKLQPKPTLESKALEIKLNLIPKMAKQSFQKFNFYPKQTTTEDNNRRLHPRHKNMKFLSLEEIDTIQLNLKHKYQKDSPHISCMKTMTVDVSRGSKEIIAKLNGINMLESGTSSVTPANKTPLSQILQNYSVEEKDKLLIHFSMKILEIQMKAFPSIVRESHTMANTQHRRKPLCKCIHLGVQVPKHQGNQSNRILLLFEEKSLHQIELDLQLKCLHFLLGLPVQSMFPRPNRLPKHFLKSNTVAMCKKAGNSGESGSLSADPGLLEQYVSFKKQSPHENSSLDRRFLEPTPVCASDPEWPRMAQRDTMVLPVLKSHVTLEKDKHHVWFQETETRGSFDLKTQENAPSLLDYHSIQISQDFTGSQTDTESSANLEKCSAFEILDSEESIFLEANPYLSQESENILFELQKGIPLENFYKVEQIKTDSKSGYSDNSGSLPIRGCRKPSSAVTPPSQESHQNRKYVSSSKIQSPGWRRHSSLDTLEVSLVSSSVPFSEEKLPWITKNRTGYSLAPLTESNIKLHLAKSQDKPHRQPESKERKKAKFDLFRRNSHGEDGDHSCTQRQEKHRRKKKVCDGESERTDYFPSKYKSAVKPHQEHISLHSERKQKQPFFYACIPADSLEIIPQTIRWPIPPKTLRKRNFRVPLLAELSSSFSM